MPAKVKYPEQKAGRRNTVILTGTITIGAAGAVSSSSAECATVVKTATKTGRYTVTLDRKYRSVRGLGAPGLVGPADAAFGNAAANAAQYRNVSTQTFDIQLFLASSGADTETTSGNVIHWAVEAQEF